MIMKSNGIILRQKINTISMKGLITMKHKKVFALTCALAAVMIAGGSAVVSAAELPRESSVVSKQDSAGESSENTQNDQKSSDSTDSAKPERKRKHKKNADSSSSDSTSGNAGSSESSDSAKPERMRKHKKNADTSASDGTSDNADASVRKRNRVKKDQAESSDTRSGENTETTA